MPTVPRYVQTERPRGYQNVQPSKGGQIVAGAWQQAGKALQGAGNTLNDMALDMQRRQNEAVAQEAMTAYEDLRHTYTKGVVENKKGKNALGDANTPTVYDDAMKWHADMVAKLLEGKTDGQKRLLEPYLTKRGQNMAEWAHNYYQKQWDTYETEQFNAGIKTMLMRAKDDPSQLESCMANIGQMGHNYNSARGLPPEKTELLVRSSWEDAGKAIVEGFLKADDPNAADAFLKKYEKQLGTATTKELRGKSKARREALQLKAERLKEKAEKEKARAAIQEAADSVLDSVKWFDGTDEEREAKATELCEAIGDAETRAKVWGKVKSQFSFEKARSNAQASREVRVFLDTARKERWSEAQYNEALATAQISDKARTKLEDPKTRAPKVTYANRQAALDLKYAIDLGVEKGGIDPTDETALEDLMWHAGLTQQQEKDVLEYARNGGNKGGLTVSMVRTAATMLYPDDKQKAKDAALYYDQVASMLEPGKKPTTAQVKNILAQLAVQGEWAQTTTGYDASRGGWFFGRGEDMSFGEALKRGAGGVFYTDDGKHARAVVPQADYDRIARKLREAGVMVNQERVEKMYIEEQRIK
ncbi:hypothetical protein [Mailhella sp.]